MDDTADQPENESGLEPGEEAASPYEEHMLAKVMALVYQSLNSPKKMRTIESWLLQAPDVGVAIGHIAFKMLMSVYLSAKKAGIAIPDTVFFGQGGAIYQVIDRLILIAQHAGVPHLDEDKIRQDSMGIVMDSIKQNEAVLKGGGDQQQGQPDGSPDVGMDASQMPQQAAAANPLSHAVGQGLQQQGLMGAPQ